jgi:hypothetical protein
MGGFHVVCDRNPTVRSTSFLHELHRCAVVLLLMRSKEGGSRHVPRNDLLPAYTLVGKLPGTENVDKNSQSERRGRVLLSTVVMQ